MNTTPISRSSLVTLLLLCLAPFAYAEDPLQSAKKHYETAAYDEALSALALVPAETTAARIEVDQYRALCLIALGRTDEAAGVVAAIVDADPRYVPPPSIASPKVQSLVAEVREDRLPDIVRSLITSGRAAFEKGDVGTASKDFGLALALLDDDMMKGWPDRDNVRALAEGFVALSAASAKDAIADASRPTPPPSVISASNGSATGVAGTTGRAPAPGAAPREVVVEPPVAIMQSMPAWIPPDTLAQTRDYEGVLKIEIGADGRVKSAKIEEPSHPAYDARLLHAARQWVFKPATRDGEPVESEKLIAIQLHPRR